MAIRENFPSEGTDYMGGESDGWEYKTIFAGTSLKHSFEMIKAFLQEEGYTDLPLPQNVEELQLFQLPTRNKQIILFEDNGYVHNPIKILFPSNRRDKKTLILCIYNDKDPEHLIRFYRKGKFQSF